MKRSATSRMAIVAIALAVAVVSAICDSVYDARTAWAETPPNPWERAKNPALGPAWTLHVKVRGRLYDDALARIRSPRLRRGDDLDKAREALEAYGAATKDDVRLLFDLGEVYSELGRQRDAIPLLERGFALLAGKTALERAAAGVNHAQLVLAYAYAKSDRPRDEHDAYVAYLAATPDDFPRMTATLNLAESEMRLGNLDEAVAGYEDTLAITSRLARTRPAVDTEALAHYGLAVALDRRGDTTGAEHAMDRALSLDPNMSLITTDENVFFVPSYERNWYIALAVARTVATMPRARERNDDRAAFLREVVTLWSGYVHDAQPRDMWLGQAKRHLVQAKRAQEAGARGH